MSISMVLYLDKAHEQVYFTHVGSRFTPEMLCFPV